MQKNMQSFPKIHRVRFFTYIFDMLSYNPPLWIYEKLLHQICKIIMFYERSPRGCGGFTFHTLIF